MHTRSHPIEYDDSPVAELPVLPGSHRHIVEEAEAKRLAVLGVVTRRSYQPEAVTETARADWKYILLLT